MDTTNEAIRLAAFVRVKEEENILELERLQLNPIVVAVPHAVDRIDGIIADERRQRSDHHRTRGSQAGSSYRDRNGSRETAGSRSPTRRHRLVGPLACRHSHSP